MISPSPVFIVPKTHTYTTPTSAHAECTSATTGAYAIQSAVPLYPCTSCLYVPASGLTREAPPDMCVSISRQRLTTVAHHFRPTPPIYYI